MNPEFLQPLEDGELDELNEILSTRGDGEGLALDAVHGFLTAIVIGPHLIQAEEWMPRIIDDGRPFESVEQAERAVKLLLRVHQGILHDLDRLNYEPILGQEESESGELVLSAHGWCEGFSLGVDLRGDTWEARMRDDPRLLELLDPVVRLATDEGVFESGDGEEPEPLSENEYDDALARIGSAVIDVQQYWREQPPDEPLPTPPAADVPHGVPRWRGGRSVH